MTALPLLVFARCAGFIFRAPGFSYPGVPPLLRVGLALALALLVAPAVRAAPSVRSLDGAAFAGAVALEFLIGSAFGTGAAVLYDGAYAGGRAIDDYVGVKAIAPNVGIVAPSGFGRVWSLAFTGAFFLSGAYRPIIYAFAGTFAHLPLGAQPDAHAWGAYAAAVAMQLLRVALAVGGPAIATAFVVHVALGALSRTIPRFGSSTLAFPLVFGAAVIASIVALPVLALRSAPVVVAP